MADSKDLVQILLKQSQQHLKKPEKAPVCFIGFDGFTDAITKVVATRQSTDQYEPYVTIAQFGHKISAASGQSCNFELVVSKTKLGGNAPIMANALLEGHFKIIFAGPIGTRDTLEPVFEQMASRCSKIIPLGPSAHSDALEFQDGKIILGKLDPLKNVSYESLLKEIPLSELSTDLDRADLFVSANWTMLPMMNTLWRKLAEEIIPTFTPRPAGRPRWMFVDLADPSKRTDTDLKEALACLRMCGKEYRVILGLNYAESQRLAKLLGLKVPERSKDALGKLAVDLSKACGLHTVLAHTASFAVASSETAVSAVESLYTPTPHFTTGAGDNFNAGYCNALLCGCSPEECLQVGALTSGYYVRFGHSPSMEQLAEFVGKG